MSNLVIVAIPDENDRVWKVSSEKVPHMTLLFLGDMDKVSNLEQIVKFVEHAATTTLCRFYLRVDRRDELGADQADVLFFKKGYDYKAIRDFRAVLLKDNSIKTAYDSATQFDGVWQPHLTLGYPAAPAKNEDENDFGFYEVSFNKVAVWTDDFDGPEFGLKDYWDEYEALEVAPMDVAMSSLQHLSEAPWSNWTKADYTLEQWHAACLVHTHEGEATSKSQCKLPVKTPDGALNRNGVHAAAAALAGARGGLKGVSEDEKKKAASALRRYYAQLEEEPPESLAQNSVMDVGADFVLEHYGVKGMRWGVRNAKGGSNTSGVGETKREGLQRYLDPQGHDVSTDVAKTVVFGALVPVLAPLSWPAQVRLVRGGTRGIKAKALDRQEKKFEKNAMSPKNFAAIHNGALDKINRDIAGINKKYPGDLTKSPDKQKAYDDEVLKAMQDGYKASANSLSNKAQTRHLDVEFQGDGQDFKIHAREGKPTPLPVRVKHATEDIEDEEITVEITGKLKRDDTGHIVGFEFDHLEQKSMAQSAFEIEDLGAEFILEHYGIKGMRWGVRKQREVATTSLTETGLLKRRTKVRATGGEAHPAHTDAVRAAVQKQKLKKSGTDALSTQELRELANRLQLEAQVETLSTKKGKKFVSKQLEETGKQELQRGLRRGAGVAAPHVVRKVKKGAATAAVTALL